LTNDDALNHLLNDNGSTLKQVFQLINSILYQITYFL